jgi:hypothetical protein
MYRTNGQDIFFSLRRCPFVRVRPTWTTSNPPAFAKRTAAGFERTQRDATLTNPELDTLPSAARCPPSLVAFEPKN